MILIRDIKIKAGQRNPRSPETVLRKKIADMLRIDPAEILKIQIVKKSLDARKKPDLFFIYQAAAALSPEKEAKLLKIAKTRRLPIETYQETCFAFPKVKRQFSRPPVVAGSGPAGLFAAYVLAKAGARPLLIERGADMQARKAKVAAFLETGDVDSKTNVQFGEGGAGTFSDGKLNTGNKDRSGIHQAILQTFVRHGAPASILYENKPHLGTDRLEQIVVSMREDIIALGGSVRFDTKLDDLILSNGRLAGIVVNGGQEIAAEQLILAIGHSARDTFHMLYDRQLQMCQKPFAVGVRVVHAQSFINDTQYGRAALDLPAADYKLTAHTPEGRNVYSFCMCPGGYVISAASAPGQAVVNGMSYSGRSGPFANAAIVVNVLPEDLENDSVFAGLKLQESMEQKAYRLGGGGIPVQSGKAFLSDGAEMDTAAFVSLAKDAVKGRFSPADVRQIFPQPLLRALCEGIRLSDQKIRGFSEEIRLVAGVESRTSSPVKILRNDAYESNIRGVYPCGEGAGYAGGIMSAAADGIRTACTLIQHL